MSPTLVKGDYIITNELAYGLRVPYTKNWLFRWDKPQRGEPVVFHKPGDDRFLIKRIVGVPGDSISFDSQTQGLMVNGQIVDLKTFPVLGAQKSDGCLAQVKSNEPLLQKAVFIRKFQKYLYGIESLPGGRTHLVQVRKDKKKFKDVQSMVVPEGEYYLMGDNRDESYDSRVFGGIPEDYILGPATHIAWSLGNGRTQCKGLLFDQNGLVRWSRTFKSID